MLQKSLVLLFVIPQITVVPFRMALAQETASLLVSLDARDASAGTAIWKNLAGTGDFLRVAAPRLETIGGVKAVVFDGKTDAYMGSATNAAPEGNGPRTIEAWVLNPRIDGSAETVVSWGRYGVASECFSLNIGLKNSAVSLSPAMPGLPWGQEHPMEDEWHHLVVTYDGKTYTLYDNGSVRNSGTCKLKTTAGLPIVIAALQGAADELIHELPLLGTDGKTDPRGGKAQVGGSIALADLKIYSVALRPEQVSERFTAEAARFGAVSLDKLDAQRSPIPEDLASTFSFGYAHDQMPAEDAQFEHLLKTIKGLGFNVIHATYTAERLALCRKHGIKMMIDVLSGTDHHVWATPVKWKQTAISLRGNADVWGYNQWNDPFGNEAGTLRTHVRSLRLWDSTHPAFCGTYQWPAAAAITNCDMPGYYDFHWKRGVDNHLRNCRTYMTAARKNNCMWGTWLSATSGKEGDERVSRSLWSANIAMAFGCKAFLWFLGQDVIDEKTLTVKPGASDFAAINEEIMPLKSEIMKIGTPAAVYSSLITRDMFDKPVAGDAPAPGMQLFPDTFIVQPLSGEFIAGVFDEKPGSVMLFVANYNAYARQSAKLKFTGTGAVLIYDRREALWWKLQTSDGVVEFPLAPGGGELLRFESGAGEMAPAGAPLPTLGQKPVNFSDPRRKYDSVDLAGWTVLIEKQLVADEPALASNAVKRLEKNLGVVLKTLPVASLIPLKKVNIYLMYGPKSKGGGYDNGLEYHQTTAPAHDERIDPGWRDCIVIYSAWNYVELSDLWAMKALIHEFAHAYQLRQWPEKEPDIKAWQNAMKLDLYQHVVDTNGMTIDKAYATFNQLEYFAELSCMYYSFCDYPPYSRAALKAYDPEGYDMVDKRWNVK